MMMLLAVGFNLHFTGVYVYILAFLTKNVLFEDKKVKL
jgi:hypothetical protein